MRGSRILSRVLVVRIGVRVTISPAVKLESGPRVCGGTPLQIHGRASRLESLRPTANAMLVTGEKATVRHSHCRLYLSLLWPQSS